MARIETDKRINPTQLGIELGRVPIRCVAGVSVETDATDQSALAAAVEAHVADPDYVDPNPPPPAPEVTNEATLRDRADAALTTNSAFLANTSPTNAQTLAQVKTLTKECSALIRLVLRKLDTVDGT